MGLFMNRNDHPEVYANDADILELNQRMSTIDPLMEMVTEQQEANHALQQQLDDLQQMMQQQDTQQSKQLQSIRNRLHGLRERELRQQQFENEVMESFVQLHAENHSFQRKLADEQVFNRLVAEHVKDVSRSTNNMADRLEGAVLANEEIGAEVKEQLTQQKRLSEQLVKQADLQQMILGRLDKQEGLTEKMRRQVDHLRSVLYERSSFLAEKIEGNYLTTSHFISKLLAGNVQPTTRFMISHKQEEKRIDYKED